MHSLLLCLLAAAPEATLHLDNGEVRVEVHAPAGAPATRRFLARGGTNWVTVAEGFIPGYTNAPPDAIRLWDSRPNPHRHLVTALPAIASRNETDETITLRMEDRGARITETISLTADSVRVDLRATLPGPPFRLDTLLSAYTFATNGTPAFVHTPGVKFDDPRAGAGRDQVTGDRSFHAPAVILQQEGLLAALVPDLNELNRLAVTSPDARRTLRIARNRFSLPESPEHFTLPALIDLNVRSGLTPRPVLTFGLGDTVIGHHIRYVRDERGEAMVRTANAAEVGYSFELLLGAQEPAGAGYARVARHQWAQSGHPVFMKDPHLAMPFAEYVRVVTGALHAPGLAAPPVPGYTDHGSWLEWEMAGQPVGGYRCAAPFWNDVIHHGTFWNDVRDATGMFAWGHELGDEAMVARARRIVNLALAAPRDTHGFFPTLYDATARKWGRGWTDPAHGQNRLFLRDARGYEIAALCKTGAHLLDFHFRAEPNPRIPALLAPLGDWLAAHVDERGRTPSFVTEKHEVSPVLLDSAQPAAAMWFLAELHRATREPRYLDAARRIAAFLEREVMPTARWIDMEQYLSCGAKPMSMVRDEWQGQWFRGNLCVIWAAEGFAALHRADGDARWLREGERCVDYLSLTQCVWRPHFIYTANPFGGFGVDNGDSAPMLDARQAETVRSFLYFGLALGRADLIERGVAAARSSCVLITHPRHTANGVFPHSRGFPEGLGPENIDHEAHPQCPMRTHAAWGEGSAVHTGLAEVRRALGGLYLDPARGLAIGADGVRVVNADFTGPVPRLTLENRLSGLPVPWEHDFRISLRGAPAGLRVSFSGQPDSALPPAAADLLVPAPRAAAQ